MMKNIDVRENDDALDSFSSGIGKIEAMKRLKIVDDDGDVNGGAVEEEDNSCPYPDRPGEPDCLYYLRTGTCSYGSQCRFNHPPYDRQVSQNSGELPVRDGQPYCKYYLKTGTCKYGSSCRYHHPQYGSGGSPVLLNNIGLPMRKDEKPCPYYMRTGVCKFGLLCKFDHPQSASAGDFATGLPAYGSGGLAFVPSSSVPYTGGVSEFGIPKTTYVSSPSLQVPQTYMPVFLSPSQGWSTYMGTMTPSLFTNVLNHQASNGPVHLLSASVSQLPDKSDQPECRDFVNTGSCKYGSDCKYHHPKDKIAPFPSNMLGPLGLPLRPGQAVCALYSLYGVCKYGPTCKYDHPMGGYLYNHNLGIPSILPDPPFYPYQWTAAPSISLSKTSSSKSSKSSSDQPRKGDQAAAKKKEQQPADLQKSEKCS